MIQNTALTAPAVAVRPSPFWIKAPLPYKHVTRVRTTPRIYASSSGSEYSRRRTRRSSIPKTKIAAPKGFAPRPQVATETKKKDQTGSKVEEPKTSGPSDMTPSIRELNGVNGIAEEHKIGFGSQSGISHEMSDAAEDQGNRLENVSEKTSQRKSSPNLDDDGTVGEQRAKTNGYGITSRRKHPVVAYNSEEIEVAKVVGIEEDLKDTGSVIEVGVVTPTARQDSGSGIANSPVEHKRDTLEEVERKKSFIEEEIGDMVLTINPSVVSVSEKEGSAPTGKSDPSTFKELDQNAKCNVDEEPDVVSVGEKEGSATAGKSDLSTSKELDQHAKYIVDEESDIVSVGEKEGSATAGKSDLSTSKELDQHAKYIVDEESDIVSVGEKEGSATAGKSDLSTSKELDQHAKYIVHEEPDVESLQRKADAEAQAQKQIIQQLAEEHLLRRDTIFVYPEEVKPGQVIEVFLNRSLTTLINENNVLLKGAFNGWRWKSFTERMHKTDLKGDWWSCRLDVPVEAYNIDFVFFNGGTTYENNNYKDFSISVVGGMDESSFEDFLLEEKRKELERLAAELAERERQAEEQRRRDAEKAASEAERSQARAEVDKKREAFRQVVKLAQSAGGAWYTEPSTFKGGDTVRFYYNRRFRTLERAAEVWIHGGHNNWTEGVTIVERFNSAERKGSDWWYVDVIIPERARVVDWVLADGPPQKAKVYDNNHSLDFHATVPMCVPEEMFWVEEEDRIYTMIQDERKKKEEALRRKAEKTACMLTEMKERTLKMFLMSEKHIVYTEPLDVRAGSTVTVFYNPSNTVLNGKPEVWLRCSFNRWTHQGGPLSPAKMVREENGKYMKATVKVPHDAYMMDFVFSDMEDGGIYDNKDGMDYHIPVTGGIIKEPPMHIVHIAVEMAPIAKVGGLGDVVTSLSRAVQDFGHNVDIILPKYDCMNLTNVRDFHFHQTFFWNGTEIKVWFGKVEGISTYFLEPQNGMFWVGCIYGKNDASRFGFFCHAALEFLLQSGSHPDIIHCHDWSSAPVSWLFKEHYMQYGLKSARNIFTIHNLEFGIHEISKAMTHTDMATTVSPTYSKEVAGNPAVSRHLHKFHGIINGIDPNIWDPYNDNSIPVAYTSENVVEGKKAAKEALQQRLGLKISDQPLVGIITRLTAQKGIHLIKHAIWKTLERNGQVVLLGSAPDPRIQNDFVQLSKQLHSSHGDRARLCLNYDEPLSHLIYAGSDFILVPSVFEPCGLTQLTAMRYGSIPVVRKTGGLYDTVFDVDNDKVRAEAQGLEPNGFSFDGADPGGVDYALNRAITTWYDSRDSFNALCKRAMEQDWSWNRPALDYLELYHAARKM